MTKAGAPQSGSRKTSTNYIIIGALVLFFGIVVNFVSLDVSNIFTALHKINPANMSNDNSPQNGHHHHHSPHDHAHQHATTSIAHSNGEDFTESNRAHWDKFAKSYTAEPWQKDIVTRVTAFLQDNFVWLGLPPATTEEAAAQEARSPPIRVLDYACGPGTVTGALGAHADEYVGLDLSDGMVAAYNERFGGAGGDGVEASADHQGFVAKAQQADLLSKNSATIEKNAAILSGPEYQGFDLVVVGLGFHHFEDLPHATRTLAARLKPGGTFAIVDLMSHEMEENSDFKRIVAHAGFGYETVKKLFEDEGGLVDFDWKIMDGEIMIRGQTPRRVFVARGKKPEGGAGEKL